MHWKTACLMALMAAPLLRAAEEKWVPVVEGSFDSANCLSDWALDGPADVSVTPDGKLRIQHQERIVNGTRTTCSVLWHREPVWGDLRFEFDAKAEPKSRCIFFFSARATGKDPSIFTWPRPIAAYADYAYEPRIELYTLGMLRSDQEMLNLRHLGGADVKPEWMEIMPYHPMRRPARYLSQETLSQCLHALKLDALPTDGAELRKVVRHPAFRKALAPHLDRYKAVNKSFQEVSIIADHQAETPVFADSAKFHRVVITVRGVKIRVEVNGKTIFDFVDKSRKQSPLKGGYFGFRNFKATEAQYDNLRVCRLVD